MSQVQINPFFRNKIQNERQSIVEKIASKDEVSTWYFPKSEIHYLAADPKSDYPSQDFEIANQRTYRNNKQRLAKIASEGGVLSKEEAREYNLSHFHQAFVDRAFQYDSLLDRVLTEGSTPSLSSGYAGGHSLTAGVISMHDYSDIANVVEATEIIDKRIDDYISTQAVRSFNVDTLDVAIDYRDSEIRVIENVGEQHVSDGQTIDYSQDTFKLHKHQVHVKATGWARLANWRHDVVGDTFGRINEDWERFYTEKTLRTLLTAGATAAAGGWDDFTATNFHFTYDPINDFNTVEGIIGPTGNGGNPDRIIMNTFTFGVLSNNTHMRDGFGVLSQDVPAQRSRTRTWTHRRLTGYQGYSENNNMLANGIVLVFDSQATGNYFGPQRTLTYNEGKPFILGMLVDRFFESFLLRPTLARRITGAYTP